jgi:hypothetical protein
VTDGTTYAEAVGRFTVVTKNGMPSIAYTLTVGPNRVKIDHEFTVLPSSNVNELVLKEAAGRIKPNPITMKRRPNEEKSKEQPATPKVPVASEPPKPKETPKQTTKKPAAGTPTFSELKVTKTSFDPPSVEFTVKLDLAGGKLLEAWASVGIKDAGKTLEIFAGAIDQGLLEVNGINFANPDPALKAQRVSMKPSATDPTLYVCTVRYPKLVLDDPATEFTIVAAIEKDKKIVKTNAAMAKVNLKTGASLDKGK